MTGLLVLQNKVETCLLVPTVAKAEGGGGKERKETLIRCLQKTPKQKRDIATEGQKEQVSTGPEQMYPRNQRVSSKVEQLQQEAVRGTNTIVGKHKGAKQQFEQRSPFPGCLLFWDMFLILCLDFGNIDWTPLFHHLQQYGLLKESVDWESFRQEQSKVFYLYIS